MLNGCLPLLFVLGAGRLVQALPLLLEQFVGVPTVEHVVHHPRLAFPKSSKPVVVRVGALARRSNKEVCEHVLQVGFCVAGLSGLVVGGHEGGHCGKALCDCIGVLFGDPRDFHEHVLPGVFPDLSLRWGDEEVGKAGRTGSCVDGVELRQRGAVRGFSERAGHAADVLRGLVLVLAAHERNPELDERPGEPPSQLLVKTLADGAAAHDARLPSRIHCGRRSTDGLLELGSKFLGSGVELQHQYDQPRSGDPVRHVLMKAPH
mmetsp:Transcript_25336/g.43773  ORF Transcript_25336/g.43773 Transcript_25336/m.43773 type:complete len:262 (-) Transcript_25336:296-1081(-)